MSESSDPNVPAKNGDHQQGRSVEIVDVDSADQLQQLVRSRTSMLAVGNRTKPALSDVDESIQLVSTRRLTGILQYEPSEFTFTAFAGTTLAEISETLGNKNQYLPFDPMMVGCNATIAGTLAAGVSGPGRHRYGGLRDFVLGARFVAGDGEMIQSGGKVVKNAAGFDIPKLLVGSCGRLAAITELTFKVFPKPVEFHTYNVSCSDHNEASRQIADLARGRWELDAIDYHCESRTLWIRMGGLQSVCDSIAGDINQVLDGPVLKDTPIELANENWTALRDCRFGGSARESIVRVPMTLNQMVHVAKWCDDHRDRVCLHSSVAGAIGWLACQDESIVDVASFLRESDMTGIVIRGPLARPGACMIGKLRFGKIEDAVKSAMDPPGRFPSLAG